MGNWKVGLISPKGCFDDIALCLCAYLVPFHVYGLAAEDFGKRKGDGVRCLTVSSIPIISYCALPCWRRKVRDAHSVDSNFIFDILASYCCPCCTIYQGGLESGLDGKDEFNRVVEMITSAVKGFDPKAEASKAKADAKDSAKEEMSRA